MNTPAAATIATARTATSVVLWRGLTMMAWMALRVAGIRFRICSGTHLFGVSSMWPPCSSAGGFSSCWLVEGLLTMLTIVVVVIACGTGVGSSMIEVITTVGRIVGSGLYVDVG